MGEITDGGAYVADLCADIAKLVVGNLQKVIEKAEIAQHLERGGMDGIASKIAQKIGVFFENQHFDAGTPQEISEHHPRGAAARNAATNVEFLCRRFVRHDRLHSFRRLRALHSL